MPRFRLVLLLALAGVASVAGGLLLGNSRTSALPPAGSDTFDAAAEVHIAARGGVETVSLTGSVTIARGEPTVIGGFEQADAEITALSLTGFSAVGPVNVTQTNAQESTGLIRALESGEEFPSEASFSAFIEVSVPSSPVGSLLLHNKLPLNISTEDINAWPPYGAVFELEPVYQFDNDGDGAVDEDTADDDGDGLIDEDRAGPDPDTPGPGTECAFAEDPDCDDLEGEDPPIELCPEASDGKVTLCDADGDGLIDEDPSCIPLVNPGGTHMKAGVCLRTISIMLAEEGTITPPPTPTPFPPTPTRTPRPPTPTRTPTGMPPVTPTATPETIFGDANCDESVDAIDAAVILQNVAGLLLLLPCFEAADVNEDGFVNAVDASLVLQFTAGIIGSLPA
jgi:hypothetical protein